MPVDGIPTVAFGFVAALDAASGDVIALVEDHVLLEPGLGGRGPGGAPPALCSRGAAPGQRESGHGDQLGELRRVVLRSDRGATRRARRQRPGTQHELQGARCCDRSRDELLTLYQSERVFHYRLRADGHVILHEPHARQAHLNISVTREAMGHAFLGGILFGAYRARAMSVVEKAARTALAPLVPAVRLWRTWRMLAGTAGLDDAGCTVWALAACRC